ncbi:MAG TPA: NUDIX hydrolase [Syntrophomonadaceae bacterium]|nr:NUDIX hydrolase [Syntrophomonadaceae bacterium]
MGMIIPVAVACINCRGRILLMCRNREPFACQWSLPGGKIEVGEFPGQAMSRELREETGLTISDLDCAGLVCEIIRDVKHPENILYHHLVYVFFGCSDTMVHQECDEGELKWFPLKDVLQLGQDLVATDEQIIDKMLIQGGRGLYDSSVSYSNKMYRCTGFSRLGFHSTAGF